MITNFINRASGRVSLRGVARVRHAAFTASTGSKQYTAGHSTSTGMRGVRARVKAKHPGELLQFPPNP